MKKFVCTYIAVIAMMVFASCSRQEQLSQQKVGVYPPHPLAGNEIILDTLGWQIEDDNTNVFFQISNRPDLFMPFWKMDVSLKMDTSSVWMPATPSSGFVYTIGPGSFFFTRIPPDTTLVNLPTSIKIKFH